MRLKLFVFFAFLYIGSQFLKAQEYYEHYQDGLVIFKIKQETKRFLSTNKQVDFKSIPLFSRHLAGYDIVEVKHLHPDIDDESLNRVYQIQLSDFSKVDEVVKILESISGIEYAELKELHQSFATPNDPYFGSQYQYGLIKIQAEEAWDISTGSSSIIVAVTDDAINVDHPDLKNVIIGGHDASTGGNNPRPCGSTNGFHGSHVSGTVGAETNNNTGVASIGYGVSIMPVKIGNCSGSLTSGYEGIVYAANNGAHVINMSWGGPGSSQYGQSVITNAWNQGVVLVAAAGNDNTSSKFYPAGYNNVVTVASTDNSDKKSSFSNYGNWINISAPGSDIVSTDNNTGYQYSSGTSMASPLVSGLVGLMRSYAPSATPAQIVSCLYSSADDISSANPGYNGMLGSGRINALKALQCLSAFNVDYDASIKAINSPIGTICANVFVPEIELRNNGAKTITSATISYDWGGAAQSYNWSGSLTTGQSAVITLPSVTLNSGTYTFSATVSSPNGQTDENPSNNNLTSSFTMNSIGEEVTLNISTDCWGTETKWEVKDDNNVVVESGGPYTNVAGGTSNTYNFCLSKACYTFTITDEYGDGMSGAQYQNCSTNGNYEMLDENNNVLFNMTAPNGDFGNSASHPFCLVSNLANDAGITNIVSPTGVLCTSSVEPQVRLQNFGTDPLTSVTINYQTSGGVQTFAWTGNLTSNQSELVVLPAIFTANGQQTITVYTSNPNGQTDENSVNDQTESIITIQNSSASLPFIEDFESDVIAAGKWSIVNPDNSTTWERVTTGGTTPGSNAFKIDFFNYQQSGRRDGLISPKIDLTTALTAEMSFEHAYRRFNQNAADSLIIYVSTDCGVSWNRVFANAEDGSGSFATQTTNTAEFTPSAPNDWCIAPINAQTSGASCFTINMNAFVGNDIFVKFESYNAGTIGNNLYIDNINIDGTFADLTPIPDISADKQQVCTGGTVVFTDQSSNSPTSWNWSFPGGSPATSTAQNPTVTYATSGNYDVTLEVTNASGTQSKTFTNQVIVDAPPSVNAIASEVTICEGESTNLSANGASSYTWDNGLGNGASHTVSPTVSTTYEVTGTSGDCSNTATVEVIVTPGITVSVSASQQEVCAGNSVTLTAGGASSYTWNNGLGSGATQTVSPTATTIYEVTGTDGNCSNTATVEVVVTSGLNVTVSASQQEVCIGNSVTLTAGGASSYLWDNGLGSGGSKSVSPTTTTTYTVSGTDGGCSNDATITITVKDAPVVQVSANNQTICEGDNTTLNASGADSYSWSPASSLNTSTGSSVIASPTSSTVYTVIGSNLCGTDSETVSVSVDAAPSVPSITQVGNVLSVNLQAGEIAQWYLNGNLIGSGSSITMTADGNYRVEITNSAGCSSSSNGSFVMDTSSLTQNELNAQLSVYPNPTDGTVQLKWGGMDNLENVYVFDAIGRIVLQFSNIIENQLTIDLTSFETGVYVVRIKTINNTISKKITKR